jgi:tRNA(fMet)-specific endonuclease VapC
MDRCLLDTSTLSDIIKPNFSRKPSVATSLKQYLRSHGRLTFSEISCYEILRGLRKKRALTQIQRFEEFRLRADVLSLSYQILDRAASLWAEGQLLGITVGDSDLMIAASAIVHRLPLATANEKHFAWIGELTLLNWREK